MSTPEEEPVVVVEPMMPVDESTTTEQQQGDEDDEVSALRDNIARKGRNAYYFAHDKTPTGPKWDGKPEPKLLSTSSSSGKPLLQKASSSFDMHASTIRQYAFSDGRKSVKLYIDYKVIVGEDVMKKAEEDAAVVALAAAEAEALAASETEATEEGVEEGVETPTEPTTPPPPMPAVPPPPILTQDDIRIDYTEESLSLMINANTNSQSLVFTKLAGSITSATFKLKPDDKMLVLILKKAVPGEEWRTINDKGNSDVEVV